MGEYDEQTINYGPDRLARTRQVSLVIYQRDGAQVVPLVEGFPVVVGRSEDVDLTIRDPALSREHARFELEGRDVRLRDCGSTNGTYLNGEPVEQQLIAPGDEVTLGSVTVCLHVVDPEVEDQALASHDAFLGVLDDELARARTFGRTLGLLFVRAAGRDRGHVSHWCGDVRTLLRHRVDRLGLFSADTLEILVPEANAEGLRKLAADIRALGRRAGHPPLLCGMALYPADGGSAEALVDAAHGVVRGATREVPSLQAAQLERRDRPFPVTGGVWIAQSPAMRSLQQTMEVVAQSDIPVLIIGETGAGKELVARGIHHAGRRAKHPLQSVNCAAVPDQLVESTFFGHERGAFTGADKRRAGVFEVADRGVVFLDEIGELSPAAQAALLRVLETSRFTRVGSTEEISVDVRVIAATHRDLEQMCERGAFRWDLFYRLSAMTLKVPPLRDRGEDIVSLAEHFARQAAELNESSAPQLSAAVQECLVAYGWPGNVRELNNVMQRAVLIAQGNVVQVEDLSERMRRYLQARGIWVERKEDAVFDEQMTTSVMKLPNDSPIAIGTATQAIDVHSVSANRDSKSQLGFKSRVRQFESYMIRRALDASGGNKTAAARSLRMPLRTLTHKLNDGQPAEGASGAADPDQRRWQRLGHQAELSFRQRVLAFERELIDDALQRCGGQKTAAARDLGMPIRTLVHKLSSTDDAS